MKHCLAEDPPTGNNNDSPHIQAFRPNVRSIFRFNNKTAAKKKTTTQKMKMTTNQDRCYHKDQLVIPPSKVGTKLFRFNKKMMRNKNFLVNVNKDDIDNIPLLEISNEVQTTPSKENSEEDDTSTIPIPDLTYYDNNKVTTTKKSITPPPRQQQQKYRPTITRASAIFSPDSPVVESSLLPLESTTTSGNGDESISLRVAATQTNYPEIVLPDIFSPKPRMEFFFAQQRDREHQQQQHPQSQPQPNEQDDDVHTPHFGSEKTKTNKKKIKKQKLHRSSSQISHLSWFHGDLPTPT